MGQVAMENMEELLKKHGQVHVLGFFEELGVDERADLLGQIEELDFSKIDEYVQNFVKKCDSDGLSGDIGPAPSYGVCAVDSEQERKYCRARKLGEELISAGKVAAFVVAGGQGTRLGFDGPKGDFRISPVKNKTLFQLFAEFISSAAERYGAVCPWYIMTSPLNHVATGEIFRANDYYGLKAEDVFVFEQGTLPNFDLEGRLLLADKGRIASSPDGHGGSLKALYRSGALEDMRNRGIEYVSYFQVDNPLINIFDPLFIGLHALDEAEMSSKALVKTGPMERVGNFCMVDGKVAVIEYSDLPDEQAERRNPDGSLVFELGSIAIHIINRGFIERLNGEGDFSLPIHRAVKKIPHINARGERVEPTEANGVKLESFVFDALPLASNSVILQTERSEEFGPVKNATGVDSAETARAMMVARAASWLERAGVSVPRKAGSPDCVIEIAPSFALAADDVKAKVARVLEIKPGDEIYLS